MAENLEMFCFFIFLKKFNFIKVITFPHFSPSDETKVELHRAGNNCGHDSSIKDTNHGCHPVDGSSDIPVVGPIPASRRQSRRSRFQTAGSILNGPLNNDASF